MSTEVLEQAVATTRGVLADVSPDQCDAAADASNADQLAAFLGRRV